MPVAYGALPDRGCPYDCGLCTEHEQHTCIGLLEITSACNLECLICFAASGPGGKHLSVGEAGLRTTLVCTLQPGVNDHEMGHLVQFGAARPWITGVSFQPATYTGRYVLPEQLEQRVTFPDVITGVAKQTAGQWREADFSPLPCAHPNAHTLAYAYRRGADLVPLAASWILKTTLIYFLAGSRSTDSGRGN